MEVDKKLIAKYMDDASKNGINCDSVEACIKLLEKSNCINDAAKLGTKLIKENCKLFNSDSITQLFLSMIPEAFK